MCLRLAAEDTEVKFKVFKSPLYPGKWCAQVWTYDSFPIVMVWNSWREAFDCAINQAAWNMLAK